MELRQFDVCRTPDGALAVVVQDDLLAPMATRVVVPLVALQAGGPPIEPLNPVLTFGSEQLKLLPQRITTLPVAELGPRIASVAHVRDRVEAALAVVLRGL